MALADLKIYSERLDPETGYDRVQEVVLVNIFKSASDKISKMWQEDFYENICCTPEMNQKLAKIENDLNRIWIACRSGQNSIENFELIVHEWLQFHLENLPKFGDSNYVPF